MSRSKSYDESVARKALGEKGGFSLVNLQIVNGEKMKFRRSAGRLDSESKRGAKYFPSSDSETDNIPDGTSSPRRPPAPKVTVPKVLVDYRSNLQARQQRHSDAIHLIVKQMLHRQNRSAETPRCKTRL